ncbi:MAG TPA: Tad domain-containing protein [Allosphingosinicella sp.]|nr:Tad domain-containing protein [Allosphingosinicella sp.]
MFGFGRRKAADSRRGGGFLTRLARDSRGNTLAIVGAALVPLTAMIGAGVDMSRAYMAKTRLQMACDAAALAGRRIMLNDTMTTEVSDEAKRFFNYNFNQGQYQTTTFTPTVTRPVAGTVRVAAATNMPTTIMRIFGFSTLPLSVTCEASLNFVNTDIMLVLDTTGSMNRDVNDENTDTDSERKIYALRLAVMALYNELRPTQTQLEAQNLRLRYGIVPYSSTVNVGRLLTGLDSGYIRGSTPYQAREAYYNTPNYTDTPITTNQAGLLVNPGAQTYSGGQISNTNCGNFGSNRSFTQGSMSFTSTGVSNDADIYDPDGAAGPQANEPNPGVNHIRYQFSRRTSSWSNSPNNRTCERTVTVTRRTFTGRYRFTSYRWTQSTFDTAGLRGGSTTIVPDMQNAGGTVATPGYYNERSIVAAQQGATTATADWNGCIEERDTTSSINTSTDYTIPVGALDLNFGLIPSVDENRWRPHWPAVLWRRDVNQASTTDDDDVEYMGDDTGDTVACPSEARRLQAWTAENLQTYVNGLQPRGFTYHDIGMLWGARMLSNPGVFAADNPDTHNGMPVTRHIIFMTDGVLTPQCTAYSAWGIERNDQRVTGAYNCSAQYNRHMQRFRMICNQARSAGYSVWVIAFGTTLTSDMAWCASNPTQASTATDQTTLINRFKQIGANIGALRLTQ